MADTYISPTGNPEVWEEKPEGYYTPEEWQIINQPTRDEQIADLSSAFDNHCNQVALSAGFTSADNVALFRDSTNLGWQNEYQYFSAWYTNVCEIYYKLIMLDTLPTPEEMIAMLPPIEWGTD